MTPRKWWETCGRSLFAGANLIIALTSLTSALSALRWQRAAEPCVWISNPFGSGACGSIAWNVGLAAVLGLASAGLILQGVSLRLTRLTRTGLAVLVLRAAFDVVVFYRLVAAGEIVSSLPAPLSLGVIGVLVADVWLLGRSVGAECERSWRTMLLTVTGIGCGQVLMIALHVQTFGSTDYRRDADVAIVLGARVYPDGTLSLALSDRLDTAVELFREGRVRFVLVSGATGIEGINEATAMRNYLIKSGLPEDRVLVDSAGANTLATARNARRLMAENKLKSALVVSHYFHLARCKLLFEEQGVSAVTVPARMTRRLVIEEYYFARECVGYLWYALTRPLRPVVTT